MAINKVTYGSEILIDLTDLDVSADTVAKGIKAIDKAGNKIIGTFVKLLLSFSKIQVGSEEGASRSYSTYNYIKIKRGNRYVINENLQSL